MAHKGKEGEGPRQGGESKRERAMKESREEEGEERENGKIGERESREGTAEVRKQRVIGEKELQD